MLQRPQVAKLGWTLFAIWFVVLFALSSMSMPPMPQADFQFSDKVLHAGYFFGGGLFLVMAFSATYTFGPWRLAFVVLGTIALVGLFDECHQLFTPHRSGGDLADWIADVVGGLFAILVSYITCYRWLFTREFARSGG